ncbi:MAG: type IX secretion system membrane protein PorP/SprF [Bacteroidetes bacterium]|nr:type IX secretion system membrane protein PorP/SprF [Bacteroidota bacterium]
MRQIIFTITFAVCATLAFGQQELMVSQYMFNGVFINPGYAGSHKYWEATALHRTQWVNLDGAPQSQMIAVDGPLMGEKLGLGGIIIHDKIGDTEQFEFSANGAYHLVLDAQQKTRLSIGLRAGFTNYTSRLDETFVFDEDDPVFSQAIQNKFVPKLGAGAYLYSERWYAGVSVPTIFAGDDVLTLKADSIFNGTDDVYFEDHMFITGGMVFDLNENVLFKPSVLVKYHPAAPLEVDFNANFLIYEKVWIGASYRTQDALIGILELNVTPQIRIGYAYDLTLTDIADYSSGSHEVMLGYNFGKEVIKMKSPRYF